MKLLSIKNSVVLTEFDREELEILTRTLAVPLYAFGLESFLEKIKIPKSELEAVQKKLSNLISGVSGQKFFELSLLKNEIDGLKEAFKVACDIADPNEIHALIGYTMKEALGVQKSLEDMIVNTKKHSKENLKT